MDAIAGRILAARRARFRCAGRSATIRDSNEAQAVLRRLLARLSLRKTRPGYFSRFGGLWTDRLDADAITAAKLAERKITPADAELLRRWRADGYVILPAAVAPEVVERINAEVETIWNTLDPRFRVERGGVETALDPRARGAAAKLLDLYVHSQSAREAAFAPQLLRFLAIVFDRPPLLFQSLSFEKGSEQPIHQDAAYVVTRSPMEFAAAWIALEDVRPGSGELSYYTGSHRLPEHLFPGGTRNWHRKRHGDAVHKAYLDGLHTRSQAMGLPLEQFRPKQGDVLIWSADLAHGGSPIEDKSLTRKSLVCHYCPSDVEPYYFASKPRYRTVRAAGPGASYASSHYPLGE
jgi:hypothetical protein